MNKLVFLFFLIQSCQELFAGKKDYFRIKFGTVLICNKILKVRN